MHATQILHENLKKSCSFIHKTRLNSLMVGVSALLNGNVLSVAGLGHSSPSLCNSKSQIKRMDYLIGNSQLHSQRHDIYGYVAQYLLSHLKRPLIIVDWSGVSACGKFHMLSASVAAKGRAINIYNEVYEECHYGSRYAHRHFLESLAQCLPNACRPIIMTDAGFRNPWIQEVSERGWDYITRVRHNTQIQLEHGETWLNVPALYEQATSAPAYLGCAVLAKANPIKTHLYLTKERHQYRKHRNLKGHVSRCSQSRKKAKGASEPWLLASSLSLQEVSATEIILFYKKRMQIEETFRDLKSTHVGFSFSDSRTRSCKRFENLLMIATLATLVLWMIGLWAKQQKLEYGFQANTIKIRAVNSIISLAKRVLKKLNSPIPKRQIRHIYRFLPNYIGNLAC